MLVYFLLFVCLLLLGLLYRYIPNRRVFWYFCLTLGLVAGIAWLANRPPAPAPKMTEAEKYAMLQQQKIFIDWYAGYQKNIDQLDHNWQWYHNILENFKAGNIDIQTAHVRLNQLDGDARLLRDQLRDSSPPQELNDACYDLCIELNRKTADYADAQYRAITLCRAASDPIHLQTDDPQEQSRSLQEIMIRESPSGLFTAGEILSIRTQLSIPEDTPPEPEESAS